MARWLGAAVTGLLGGWLTLAGCGDARDAHAGLEDLDGIGVDERDAPSPDGASDSAAPDTATAADTTLEDTGRPVDDAGVEDAADAVSPEDAVPEDTVLPVGDTGVEDAADAVGPEDAAPDTAPPTDTAAPDAAGDTFTPVDTAPASLCGNGALDPGEACDDDNDVGGDGCAADCQLDWGCPALPVSCAGASPATQEHHLVTADRCGFALRPWTAAQIAAREALNDAVVARSGGLTPLEDVLDALNRQGTAGISPLNADRLHNHDWRGFRWNSGDQGVDYWYPQGITGSSDGLAGGLLAGHDVILVSWYHKTESQPTKGVRVSLADVSDLDDVDYRHLLLVEATGSAASPDFVSVETAGGDALHAGGIAWYGDNLYVADTTGGLRVFDLSRTMRVTDVDDADRIGISAGRFDAHGYRYAAPEKLRYTVAGAACPLRFSFVALDRTSSPPALVTGEYRADDVGGRVVAWDLDPATGLLELRQGEARPTAAWVGGQTRVQGAVRNDGNIYMSSSSQYQSFGRLYRTAPGFGESSISAWVYGAEDLYVHRSDDTLWTAAEHPDHRDVVGIPIRVPGVP